MHETIGLNRTSFLCIFGKPYIIGDLLPQGLNLLYNL